MASQEYTPNKVAEIFPASASEIPPAAAGSPLIPCTDYRLCNRHKPSPDEFRPAPVMFRLKTLMKGNR